MRHPSSVHATIPRICTTVLRRPSMLCSPCTRCQEPPPAGANTIQAVVSAAERQDLLVFLNAIDGRTDSLASATDTFRDNMIRSTTAQVRHANLTGDQEPPPGCVTTTATGTLTLTINAARTQIDFILDVSTALPEYYPRLTSTLPPLGPMAPSCWTSAPRVCWPLPPVSHSRLPVRQHPLR